MATKRLTRTRLARTVIVAAGLFSTVTGPAPAQEARESTDAGIKVISINGWDFKIPASSPGGDGGQNCSLSSTFMAQPTKGAAGGRITLRFDGPSDELRLSSTITGGADKGQPIEIWVDRHLIADQRFESDTTHFSKAASQSVVTLFKAGRRAEVRFRRGGRNRIVPVSLNGFTRAVRTARRECRS